jgi:hypothetical protein
MIEILIRGNFAMDEEQTTKSRRNLMVDYAESPLHSDSAAV